MYDLVCMGRSSIDLYSNNPGVPFTDISSFGAFVGGCPTNVAVGARRLGLSTALLSAVGADPVGEFVLNFLRKEGIDTGYIPVKRDRRTSAVVLGIEPPDNFPLVFYRDNCADVAISIDDVDRVPFQEITALFLTGTALADEPSRTATFYAAERAAAHQVDIILDLDFRPDQWDDPRAFGVNIRRLLPFVVIAFGTEDEFIAASAPQTAPSHDRAVERVLEFGVEAAVMKRGPRGASVYDQRGAVHSAPAHEVQVVNALGAGDAFASAFLYAWLNGAEWAECVQYGNAAGAIVVTRQGCANFMPTLREVQEMVRRPR